MSEELSTDHTIPYARQWVDERDVEAVAETLRGDWLTTGPAVDRFEAGLCRVTGAAQAVAVDSGTAALHAAYHVVGLGPGDEVVTSPLTFAATANAALYCGAEVRFADVDPATGLIDPEAIEEVITDRTRVITGVDYAGHPADYDAIGAIADRHGLVVVADGAHSLGARRGGRPVGRLADVTTLSFHPVKPITTGEGGAVVTDDGDRARRAAEFRNHGITRDRRRMHGDEGPWDYEMHDLGVNYRITDLQCALGTSQLRRLDDFIGRRRQIATAYLQAFADVDELKLPTVEPGVESGWHLFVIRTRSGTESRRALFERLQDLGLGVQVHYRPVYLHPFYRYRGFEPGICPAAEDFYRRAISLPLFPAMTDREVDAVIDRVLRGVEEVF